MKYKKIQFIILFIVAILIAVFIGYRLGYSLRIDKTCQAILNISGNALDHLNWTKRDFENLNELKKECYKKLME